MVALTGYSNVRISYLSLNNCYKFLANVELEENRNTIVTTSEYGAVNTLP